MNWLVILIKALLIMGLYLVGRAHEAYENMKSLRLIEAKMHDLKEHLYNLQKELDKREGK